MSVKKMKSLRKKGMSYREIGEKFNITGSTVSYRLNEEVRKKHSERRKAAHKRNPLKNKIRNFLFKKKYQANKTIPFTEEELRKRIGDNPKCYLTGVSINLNNSKEYNLDHIVPASLGGENSLENCGLSSAKANQLKGFFTIEELKGLCELFLANCGRLY